MRSYARLDVAFDPRINIFTGANGAGKTNLLEALSLLSPGRGLRRAKVEEMARREGESVAAGWGVVAQLNTVSDTHRLVIGQNPDHPRRRTLRIDGSPATGLQLAELLTVMWLTPAQDRLFTGPASDRRKFLDRFTLSHTPSHGHATARYEKARAERNRLLSDNVSDAAWYRALEADLARLGASIAGARTTTIELLREEIATRPEGAFPKASVSLEGVAEDLFADGQSHDDVEGYLRDALSDNRGEARRAGRTLIGPHRSDLKVVHAPKSMPAGACSTGEQKALLIGLVLAHARAHPDRTPILLLDEIAAHLDVMRRAALADELDDLGSQVFLTGTDLSLFKAFSGRKMDVRDGQVGPANL